MDKDKPGCSNENQETETQPVKSSGLSVVGGITTSMKHSPSAMSIIPPNSNSGIKESSWNRTRGNDTSEASGDQNWRKSIPLSLKIRMFFYRIFDRNKIDLVTTIRTVRGANPDFNNRFDYFDNEIVTSRYTIWSFIPMVYLMQFLRIVNCYFLFLIILQAIPSISPISPWPLLAALLIVLTLTAVKYGFDDLVRHWSDKRINGRTTQVIAPDPDNPSNYILQTTKWKNVKVGQILNLKNNEDVPADILILSTSEPDGICSIEAADLDGENTMKYRQSLRVTNVDLGLDLQRLGRFNGQIDCEPPNNHLTRFDGRLKWMGEMYALSTSSLLLRGSVLRNTAQVFGIVIYAGHQTKLMKNSGKPRLKKTQIDVKSNRYFYGTFAFMLVLIIIAAWQGFKFESGIGYLFKLSYGVMMPAPARLSPAVIGLIQMWSHLILIQTLIPIALYLSFETIQIVLSRSFINGDVEMYDAETDTKAEARSTQLNEDLGQIQYLFSDKTGTLTRNMMTFKMCTIAGTLYGDKDGSTEDLVDFSEHEPNFCQSFFKFYDSDLLLQVQRGNLEVCEFFLILALCHTIISDVDKNGDLIYKAQSPDEAALVTAARNFGFVYKSRSQTTITLVILGEEVEYDLCCLLNFDNIRKRMSIIVRRNGRYLLLCKGADSTVLSIVANNERNAGIAGQTKAHLHLMSSLGLRILCCGLREIPSEEFDEWFEEYKTASTSLEDREEKLTKCFCLIEKNLKLIGGSAVEDQLQDKVPETITKLKEAGIKVWVLTGDKLETAVTIGHSCNMLDDSMKQFVIAAEDFGEVEDQLLEIRQKIQRRGRDFRAPPASLSFRNGIQEIPVQRRYGLIVNGHALYHILSSPLEGMFLDITNYCEAVMCCRVSPLQKSKVVHLVKQKLGVVTLAIGDGANDVSMIHTAHIGVGISGHEGRAAVLASDFSISQFRFLQRLLFVHGRCSYYRVSGFVRYFFYKTFAYTLSQIWFAIYCGWSAQTLFDGVFIVCYNLVYTLTAVLYYGVCEMDVTDKYSLRFPNLYHSGRVNKDFKWYMFFLSQLEGIATSVLIFWGLKFGFNPYMNPNGYDILGCHIAFGTAVGTAAVCIVTCRLSVETAHWNVANITPVFGLGSMFLVTYVFAIITSNIYGNFENYGVVEEVWQSPSFWLCIVALIAICCLPLYFVRMLLLIFKSPLPYRVQALARYESRHGIRFQKSTPRQSLDIQQTNLENHRQSSLPSDLHYTNPTFMHGDGIGIELNFESR